MYLEIRRCNYVTLTNFLELTSGYKKLLYEKRIKVESKSAEIEKKKTKAAKFQKDCEDYLVILVGKKREADEEAKFCFSSFL